MSNTNDRLNKYRNELINKTVYWLTCIDVMYEDSVYTAKCRCKCGNIKLVPASRFAKQRCSKSCGCYKTSEEFSEKQRKYILDRPEIIEDSIKKTKEWHDNNPNKVKERNRKVSDWAKNNPDKIKEKEEKHRKWFKDNRDLVLKQTIDGKERYLKDRKIALSKIDLKSFVHEDDIDLLFTINNNSHIRVRTKCPKCGNYSYHSFHNVYNYTTGKYTERLCNKCYYNGTSKYELTIQSYISTFYSGKLIRNSRKVIPPLELDLYYPEKKIAIEFNGDYWHNENHKPRFYHYNKFLRCHENGIILINVFEHYWLSDQDAIKSYMYDLFNGSDNKLTFDKVGYINNNYPPPWEYEITDEPLIDSYICSDMCEVYTCGYTKHNIIN